MAVSSRAAMDTSMHPNSLKCLEIPQGQVTRAMGDVHPQGNPHYWMDPDNGRRLARGITKQVG